MRFWKHMDWTTFEFRSTHCFKKETFTAFSSSESFRDPSAKKNMRKLRTWIFRILRVKFLSDFHREKKTTKRYPPGNYSNISHLGKRKIIFKLPFLGDMLVPWRVLNLRYLEDPGRKNSSRLHDYSKRVVGTTLRSNWSTSFGKVSNGKRPMVHGPWLF